LGVERPQGDHKHHLQYGLCGNGRQKIMKETLSRWWILTLLVIFFSTLLIHTIKLPASDDLGRHIKNGEQILSGNFDVLHKNVYSYTEPNSEFSNHHWLSGVILYLFHEAVGFKGLVIFKAIVMLIAFYILFRISEKKSGFWPTAILSVPATLVLMERTELRPEIFSYLLISIYLYLLFHLDREPRSNKIFWLIPLQAIWVNLHLFFVIGAMLVGGFLFEKVVLNIKEFKKDLVVRKLAIAFVGVILASFLNPNGIRGAFVTFPLNIKGESPILIAEDVPVFEYLGSTYLTADLSIPIFIGSAVLLLISFLLSYRRKPIFLLMASLATAYLAFDHLRALALFGIIFLIAMPFNLGPFINRLWAWLNTRFIEYREKIRFAAFSIFSVFLICLIVFGPKFGVGAYRDRGVGLAPRSNEAGEFFKQERLRGPIFNDADIGSYLIYHVYPKDKVFVDNRFGDAYSSDFFRDDYLAAFQDESAWQRILDHYKFQTIFLYQYDQVGGGRSFISRRMNDPEWALVHADPYNLIFIRNTKENEMKIRRLEITKENAAKKLKHLVDSDNLSERVGAGDIFYLLGLEDVAMSTYIDVVTRWPGEHSVWMVMGEVQLQKNELGRSLLGMMYLDKSLSLGRETAEVYSFLGLAYLRLYQYEKGEEMLKKALAIDPDRVEAQNMLEQLDERLRALGLRE
jgi:tetratricopeptide (TPR) repeat protein